jgi:hypothetical protein
MKILSINHFSNKTNFNGKYTNKNLPLEKVVQDGTKIKKEEVINFLKIKISTLKQKKEKYDSLFEILNKNTQDNKNYLSAMRDSSFPEKIYPIYEKIFYSEREEFSFIKDCIPIIEKTIENFENLLKDLEEKQ